MNILREMRVSLRWWRRAIWKRWQALHAWLSRVKARRQANRNRAFESRLLRSIRIPPKPVDHFANSSRRRY